MNRTAINLSKLVGLMTAVITTAVVPFPVVMAESDAVRAMQIRDAKVAEANALITYPWQTYLPDWKLEVYPPQKGLLAVTFPYTRTIRLHVRDDVTPTKQAYIIAHEVGHALDVSFLSLQEHVEYMKMRGRKPDVSKWYAGWRRPDFQSAQGDFAEVVAWNIAPRGQFYSKWAPKPTEATNEYINKWLVEVPTKNRVYKPIRPGK